MAVKMDRRTFMKGAAVAALAVSVSGMLTGCEDSTGDTDFGGYTAKVITWDTEEHTGSLNSETPWWAEFKVKVRLKNVDSQGWNVQCKGNFKLTIDGKSQELMKGTAAAEDLLTNNSWTANFSKGGVIREGYMNFKMTDKTLYQAIADKKAAVNFVIGVDPQETYKLDYTDRTFKKAAK